MSTCWLYDVLEMHLSETELHQVKSYLHAEQWASPSARYRDWIDEEDLPLRFRLEIDVQT